MRYHGVPIESDAVADLCRRYGVASLSVFGSVLRDDFGPESDVHVLIQPEPGTRMTFSTLGAFEQELAALVGRSVDVVLSSEVEAPGANPYRRHHILATMETVHGA